MENAIKTVCFSFYFQIHMNKGSLSGLGLQLKERKEYKSYSAFEMKIKYLFLPFVFFINPEIYVVTH